MERWNAVSNNKSPRSKLHRYRTITDWSCSRANKRGWVSEHIAMAERALGKPLAKKHPVHHVDENSFHNVNSNLVICEDQKYHLLLHVRMRVLKAGGDPNTQRICCTCKTVKSMAEFNSNRSGHEGIASSCRVCANHLSKISKAATRRKLGICPRAIAAQERAS